MKILIAPDSFKNCASSKVVTELIAKEVLKFDHVQVIKLPLADGGEGTIEAIASSRKIKIIPAICSDPLGRKICAYFGMLDDQTAIIEMAAASGMQLLKKDELNPLKTSTYGTGELIKCALDAGAAKVILAVGGSATCDAGIGAAAALGYKLINESGNEIQYTGEGLTNFSDINLKNVDPRIFNTKFITICDVKNPVTGANGAARVFSPQKGASPDEVEILETGLLNFCKKAEKIFGKNVNKYEGAGAAGGLAAGSIVFMDAKLKNGFKVISELLEIRKKIDEVDIIITGEGKTDSQTFSGKLIDGLIKLANGKKKIAVISGQIDLSSEELRNRGVDYFISLADKNCSISDSISNFEKSISLKTNILMTEIMKGNKS